MEVAGKVNVNNVPVEHCRYIVARLVDNELWYYGSWDDKTDAVSVAMQFENGLVVDMGEKVCENSESA